MKPRAGARKRYPVVVTLDADYSFPICASHLKHLADRLAPGRLLHGIRHLF